MRSQALSQCLLPNNARKNEVFDHCIGVCCGAAGAFGNQEKRQIN